MALIASCTEVSTVRFCLVVRFLAACFLAEALPCALRFAEIVFVFARAALLAADVRALRAFGVALRAFR